MNILTWAALFILFYSSIRGFPLYNKTQDTVCMIKGYQYLLGWPIAFLLTGINLIFNSLSYGYLPDDVVLLTAKLAVTAGGLFLCGLGVFYFIKCIRIIRDLKHGKGDPK